jgi:hypothetical protein
VAAIEEEIVSERWKMAKYARRNSPILGCIQKHENQLSIPHPFSLSLDLLLSSLYDSIRSTSEMCCLLQ